MSATKVWKPKRGHRWACPFGCELSWQKLNDAAQHVLDAHPDDLTGTQQQGARNVLQFQDGDRVSLFALGQIKNLQALVEHEVWAH